MTLEAGNLYIPGHVNHLSNSNIQYMKIQTKCSVLLFALVSAALGLVGCGGYYTASPGYGPYYGGYPASVTVEVGDRPYYLHGGGYYVGRTYYIWKPGHWASRNGQRVWIHGHYIVRGGY